MPVPGEGRTLLARTVAQAREWTDDVHVTAPPGDARYRVAGASVHARTAAEPSEYASTRGLWSQSARTVLLLGDTYFTAAAVGDIMACPDRDYRVFGRYGRNPVLGTPAGEIYAVSWWPEHHALLDRHLEVVHRTRAAGTVTRPPGWMLLRSWCGLPLNRHRVRTPPFVELPPDETDDLDRPADWDRHPAFGGAARAGG